MIAKGFYKDSKNNVFCVERAAELLEKAGWAVELSDYALVDESVVLEHCGWDFYNLSYKHTSTFQSISKYEFNELWISNVTRNLKNLKNDVTLRFTWKASPDRRLLLDAVRPLINK